MGKKIIILIMLSCILFSEGCGFNGASDSAGTGIGKHNDMAPQETAQEDGNISGKSFDKNELIKNLNSFNDMTTVRYADKNRLFVFADKIYLYDAETNSVLYEAENMGHTEELKVNVTETGYAITDVNPENQIICDYYDSSLNLLEQTDISREFSLSPIFVQDVAVSKDGNKIAVNDVSEGLFLCDRKEGTKQEVMPMGDLDYEARKGICSIQQISFTGDGNKIAFIADSFDLPVKDNQSSYVTYGSIGIDGSNLVNERGSEFSKLQCYDDFIILSEGLTLGGPGCLVYLYCPESGETEKIKLKDEGESENVWGSDAGNIIITALKDKSGWKIRLYIKEDGEFLRELSYECNDAESYRDPYIYMMEDYNAIILYFRPMDDNKQYMIDEMSI